MAKNDDLTFSFLADDEIDPTALELDFDLADFQLIDPGDFVAGEEQEHILQPKIDKRILKKSVDFTNARAFARQLDPEARTFAWVSGSFVFGDIVEALMAECGTDIKTLYASSLGVSVENIDSFRNCLEFGFIERFVLVLSGWFYSHERSNLVPYVYEQLDGCRNADGRQVDTQIVFGNYHAKIIAYETWERKTMTMHGSANLRTAQCVEQIMCDPDPELYEFNRGIFENIAANFGTINPRVPGKIKPFHGKRGFEALRPPAH